MNILVYGSKGWIGNQFIKLLKQQNITFYEGKSRADNDVDLLNEITTQNGYVYIGEKRTFDEEKITNDVNKLLKELI